ncbi:MAG: response regulator [Rhodocyclaceae bacterium]
MNQPVVYIVDDDAAVRGGFALLCETAGLKVECFESAESFLAAYRSDVSGCLVLDVRMGGMSGPDLHTALIRRGSQLPIIYVTAHGDIPMTVRAMKAGAVDFLTKPVQAAELLDRVQAAIGRNVDSLNKAEAVATQRQRLLLLTQRERDILLLAAAGRANKVIAKRLGISYRTVETHRSHILHKMGTANFLELAQLAVDCGFALESGEPLPAAGAIRPDS